MGTTSVSRSANRYASIRSGCRGASGRPHSVSRAALCSTSSARPESAATTRTRLTAACARCAGWTDMASASVLTRERSGAARCSPATRGAPPLGEWTWASISLSASVNGAEPRANGALCRTHTAAARVKPRSVAGGRQRERELQRLELGESGAPQPHVGQGDGVAGLRLWTHCAPQRTQVAVCQQESVDPAPKKPAYTGRMARYPGARHRGEQLLARAVARASAAAGHRLGGKEQRAQPIGVARRAGSAEQPPPALPASAR
eukprot:scaffold20818_cov112-Isochrysis_galbana.AAC.1